MSDPRVPCVWIVTTVFNRFDALNRYLKCLEAQDYPNFKLILVDHGTKDVADHVQLPDYAHLIKASSDLWWTAAANVGHRYVLNEVNAADDDLIMLQNDDSTFDSTLISELVRVSTQEDAVVGSVVVDRDTRKILHAHLTFNPKTATYRYPNKGEDVSVLGDRPLESDVLKGRGVVYPIGVVRNIGIMEERLVQYKSDHEWAHRAKRNGFRVLIAPKAVTETVLDTQAKMDGASPLRSFWTLLFGRRSTRNLIYSFKYFYIGFPFFSATRYFLTDAVRMTVITFLQMVKALCRGRG